MYYNNSFVGLSGLWHILNIWKFHPLKKKMILTKLLSVIVICMWLIDDNSGSLACVASVSVWFRSKERPRNGILGSPEMKQEPKNESGGRGRGRKETLADKPLDFQNLCSPANAAPDWLGWSNNVDICRSKVCFILRGRYVTWDVY